MGLLLPIHIVAGGLGIVFGFVALYAAKGAWLHRKSGMLFVYAMVTMCFLGALMAATRGQGAGVECPCGVADRLSGDHRAHHGPSTFRGIAFARSRFDAGGISRGTGSLHVRVQGARESQGLAAWNAVFSVFHLRVRRAIGERRRSSDDEVGRRAGPSQRASACQASVAHVFRAAHRGVFIFSGPGKGDSEANPHRSSPRHSTAGGARGPVVLAVARPRQTTLSGDRWRQRTPGRVNHRPIGVEQ